VAIFFNFGVTGATAGAQTFYFDDIAFIGGGGLPSVRSATSLRLLRCGLYVDRLRRRRGFLLQPDPTSAANTAVR